MSGISERILAIIPARGGSKGVPGKNITLLDGKPMICWTIEAARDSDCIDRIFVSTDDSEIAEIARLCGAEVPWLRPKELAGDESSIIDAVNYDLARFKRDEGYEPEFIMLLQPTSPLRIALDVFNAYALLKKKKVDSIVSVAECSTHPYLMKILDADGCVSDFMEVPLKPEDMNRQNFPKVHFLNGAIYLVRTDLFLKTGAFLIPGSTAGYEMPAERSIDIDSRFDLIAASVFKKNICGEERNKENL